MAFCRFTVILLVSCTAVFATVDEISNGLRFQLSRIETELQELGKLRAEVLELRKLKEELLDKVYVLENKVRTLSNQKTDRGRRSLLVPPVWSQCPNGTVKQDNSCYKVSQELANWPNALVYCEAYGGNLAVIESAKEQQFLTTHIQSVNGTDPGHYYWIGGLDALSNNQWFWSKTVEPLKYSHWGPGEPDSDTGHKSGRQDCLALFNNGWWDDGWCEDEHNFICEFK